MRIQHLACAILIVCASAQPPKERSEPLPSLPTMQVRRAANMNIDGKLDEASWKTAESATFQFPWNQQKGAKQKTTVRVLWDDEFLYIGYDCDDTDITAQYEKRDDPTYKDDAVEAFINPRPSQSDLYFGFEMNARAVMYDYVYFQKRFLFKRLNLEGLKLATALRGTINASGDKDQGWSLEVAIPFKELEPLAPNTPKPGDSWMINFNRWDGTEPERRLSEWSDSGLVATDPHNAKRFGTITFVN